jgi:hypothetical protein
MPKEVSPVRSTTPELELHIVKFVGGTNAVTKVYGEGCTVTYVSAGIVDVTLPADSGDFIGITGYVFEATTTADVKSYTLQHGVYNTSTRKVRLNMHESGTLTNLAALEWLTATFAFTKATS